ncbi:hypothetical protein [Couchioplanes azureus]|uniref:hypothetical protein n=1 Tax=Couchioplanes caeruleus TaxID=56438 RepID=UPI00166FC982|nr:hypothetical protein [Couchioplanes caeruleus]GGQ78516.1 hypothetical protein GCM10010166_55880 [Couchioplanes caeruleus subsp. azureus]
MNTPAARVESVALTVILTVAALAAGWASFTHVHDWTMRHAPAGTPDAFGWVNAVISELVPVAAVLTIRRRRRLEQPIGYPLALLIAAAALSLAAQLAVAQPSPSGWLLSAVPSLAFMALVKLVFTTAPPTASSSPAGERLAVSDTNETIPPTTDIAQAPPSRPVTVPPLVASPTRLNGASVIGQVTR